ncbi:MAG: 50S ribosomal protein L34e [Candidatus Bathyarchaeia archaeon]
MPKPSQRTRSRKRVNKTLPGGSEKTYYKKETGTPPHCHLCGRPLSGVPRNQSELRKLNKSRKRIWRPFGGQVCGNCLKTALSKAVRVI